MNNELEQYLEAYYAFRDMDMDSDMDIEDYAIEESEL